MSAARDAPAVAKIAQRERTRRVMVGASCKVGLPHLYRDRSESESHKVESRKSKTGTTQVFDLTTFDFMTFDFTTWCLRFDERLVRRRCGRGAGRRRRRPGGRGARRRQQDRYGPAPVRQTRDS